MRVATAAATAVAQARVERVAGTAAGKAQG